MYLGTIGVCKHGSYIGYTSNSIIYCNLCKQETEKVSDDKYKIGNVSGPGCDKKPQVKWEDYQYLLKEKQILEGRIAELEEKIEKLDEQAKERAHLLNVKTYLALADRVTWLESQYIKSCKEIISETKKPYHCKSCNYNQFYIYGGDQIVGQCCRCMAEWVD